MQPTISVEEIAATVREVTISLPLVLYLALWLGGGAAIIWGAIKLLKPKAADGSPLLFWYLRQIPKIETLFALVTLMWLALLIVQTWKQAMGTSMGPNFSEWLLSLNGLTLTVCGVYGVKRATFNAEAAAMNATSDEEMRG